jgi:hypothetical protein
MSNESRSDNVNDQSGIGKNDPSRTSDAPKSGQQSQGSAPQTDKSAAQQGGSTQKSGQQSQGGPQKDSDGMKQAGSSDASSDQK